MLTSLSEDGAMINLIDFVLRGVGALALLLLLAASILQLSGHLHLGVGAGRLALNRITVDPAQMGGVACVRGLRIPAATVANMVLSGMSDEEILADFPALQTEDIRQAVAFVRAVRAGGP